MKDILTVMKFTIKDMIKRKSFIISTIIILALIVIGFNVPNIIKSFSSDSDVTLLIVDKDNIFEGSLNSLKDFNLDYKIDISSDNEDLVKEKIRNNDVNEAIIINKIDDNIELKYIVENLMYVDKIPDQLLTSIESLYKNLQISKLHLTEDEMRLINPNFIISFAQTEEEVNGNVFAMMILSIILFYAIYFCAYQVSSSITTEKTSKIMETLVTSTSPKTIVLGKTIGIGIVGLLQMILYLVVAIISANIFIDKELLNVVLDLSSLTYGLMIITFIYFILGYSSYALLYALTGSTVSKPEDVQNANGPVAIISVVSFYLSYFTMMNPTSSLNKFASLFPLSSPFCMPFRIMMGLADYKDVIISILILIITIIIIAKVAIKIYSNAILNYGTKLSIKDMINMYKQK